MFLWKAWNGRLAICHHEALDLGKGIRRHARACRSMFARARTHVHVHACAHTCTHTLAHRRARTRTRLCTHVHARTCTHTLAHTCARTCARTQTHAHMCMHTDARTHMHALSPLRRRRIQAERSQIMDRILFWVLAAFLTLVW